ncbi:SRPBCC family protein [Aquihabitans sp. G128]|uniref:SRPBCC family protein n=1 Tax=Aquihabitans sp. G128 TaxID=2849779 RepID=UPI001C24DF49|nr:SRPBCC family protein [Aquihabitans sp. G128]QXC59294.1 SRPBCC family protein [Aquihabitans sp. G128]
MAKYRMRVRTDQSPDEAFDYLADLRNFPEWDPGTKSAKQVRGDGPGEGASYELDASGQTFTYTVKAYDRVGRRVQAEAPKSWVTSQDTITVVPEGTGSVVTYEAILTLTGPLKLGDPILQVLFNRIGSKAADGLTEQLAGTRLE